MDGGELVSVIVPAHDAAATIGETLDSALAQTYRNLEVIVVDDGSTDATAEIVTSVAARDPRVRFFRQPNAGVAAARNFAIGRARGTYVAPLDADDLWHPEKIALQEGAMRHAGGHIGVVYCWWRIIDMESRVAYAHRVPYSHEGDVYTALIMGNFLGNASTPLIRRTCLIETGGYDPSLYAHGAHGCEDLDLYLRLAERYDYALVRRFLVGYRRTPGSMASDPRRMARSQKTVLARARDRHPELPNRLFLLAIARCEYQRGRNCWRRGRLQSGLLMWLNALRRDPAAMIYRSAEGPYRMWQRVRSSRLPWLSGRQQLAAKSNHAGEAIGQPFLAVRPEPVPGPASRSSLYAWRCATFAASIADRHHRPTRPGGDPRAPREAAQRGSDLDMLLPPTALAQTTEPGER